MRLSIVLITPSGGPKKSIQVHTTVFNRWYSEARPSLFPILSYSEVLPQLFVNGLIPKIGKSIEKNILEKLCLQKNVLAEFVADSSRYSIYAHRIVAHFVKCLHSPPYFFNDRDGKKKSEDYKVFSFRSSKEAGQACAILNSTSFYFFYLLFSDAYHCGRELILKFPCSLSSIGDNISVKLTTINQTLMEGLKNNSIRRKIKYHGTGWIAYDEFYPRLSKSIIDEIDRVLAQHYGFTDEELDFIINYDIKYRLGRDAGEQEDA